LVTICSGVCLVHFMLRVSWPQPAAVGTLIGLDQDLGGTSPGKGYFAILRLYGPTEAALNKSWKPGDIELLK